MHWVLFFLIAVNGYRFERIAHLPEGVGSTVFPLLVGDTNHNGLDELIFSLGGYRIWEYRPVNKYERVYVWPSDHVLPDTFLHPKDVGDVDQDGLADICAHYGIVEGGGFSVPRGAILESKDTDSYPTSIAWWDTSKPIKYTDLDNDGKMEIFCFWWDTTSIPPPTQFGIKGIRIYENRGNNSFAKVFSTERLRSGFFLFGDFDKDGKRDFFVVQSPKDTAFSWECVGDDEYEQVWEDYPGLVNVTSVWSGNDTDGDGNPEIFLTHWRYGHPELDLFMYEMTGDNTYELTYIETVDLPTGTFMDGKSTCGDVDRDGIEEIILSTGFQVFIYKAVGNNKYERIWEWWNDMGSYPDVKSALVVCHDFNRNGYEEIIISGEGGTSVFEIDTTYGITSKPPISKSPNLSISPNPCKGVASIEYQGASRGPISLEVYDATGRLVRTLTRIQSPEPKAYSLSWDGRDNKGKLLPSGIYFCELRARDYEVIKKMILVR